ncbi:ATP-binding protein [Methylobacter sp. YRD-M1]|uniref:ATP-binding protein n=1 Tax=Methylobacter sp. YRD-M1 TaxID=2911520 RepID=UPI00227A2F6E|nr:ATP-binding protein [Methylobacter sp. YRD-M1]WAK00266.1 ATP-binding protein [Methylobacter sp. YRD-M1]
MKFRLPRSLFGRMIWILLTGLIVAQSMSMAIHRHERSQMVARSNSVQVAQRIADIGLTLDSVDPALRQTLINVFRKPGWLIALNEKPIGPMPAGWVDDTGNPFLHAGLNELLDNRYPARIMINKTNPQPLLVQVGLHDGAWVVIQFRLPDETAAWPSRMLLQLLILVISVLGLSLFAVRWVTRPLLQLANAAEQLGKDIHQAPLDERGPVEVRRAAHAFNTMQTRLVRYIQDRTRFLAAISHDLKTPITRLRLRAELMDDPGLREKFVRDLDDMENMVVSTLDFMRGMDQQEAVQPIDMMALLESLQSDAQEMKRKVIIEGAPNASYSGKPLALKRCLGNLVDNALKYGQSATIRIEDNPDQLTILIRDQGPGIPEDKLEQVFEPFYRLEESRSRRSGGTGLGLSIARNIAQAHGGRLFAKNASGGGLEVVLILPRSNERL